MKKLITLSLSVLTLAIFVHADPPYVNNVTSNSIVIMAEQGFNNAPAWVGNTNTYAQGEIVKNNGKYYWAVVGGISTNLGPIHSVGTADTQRDGVTWRAFSKRKRNGLAVVNVGTNDVSISLDYPAVAGSGIVLKANGGSFSLDDDSFQGRIYSALSGAVTNLVSSQNW